MDSLNSLYAQVKEVVEANTKFECNRLLDTGEWIFLNAYKTTRLIANDEYTQENFYCLGKII